jgi:hypothetical protein
MRQMNGRGANNPAEGMVRGVVSDEALNDRCGGSMADDVLSQTTEVD